ncbi:hypothetical protein [Actinokineospora globicatena]|uniref:Uncharacterized protein n=1 Tax=Actinokineospora globicatena TaxID=103729 RepID=A0A9W6QM75_9PSEU|nr:hypothetical protein [Actinokineospora globicatena]GLW92157.1 hypothetical protein Aglo03_29730 [Actinokineospora globicatena]
MRGTHRLPGERLLVERDLPVNRASPIPVAQEGVSMSSSPRFWRRAARTPRQSALDRITQAAVAPAFQLVTFGGICCYVELLVSRGYSPVLAAVTAALAAVGTGVASKRGPARPARS